MDWFHEFVNEHMVLCTILGLILWGTVIYFTIKFALQTLIFVLLFFLPFKFYNDWV